MTSYLRGQDKRNCLLPCGDDQPSLLVTLPSEARLCDDSQENSFVMTTKPLSRK